MAYKNDIQKVLGLRSDNPSTSSVEPKTVIKNLYKEDVSSTLLDNKPPAKTSPPNVKRPNTYVPPDGDPLTAQYVIVGEQPGRREVKSYPRRPFIGPAGKLFFNECCMSVGISRNLCYETNFVKDLDKPLRYYINLSLKQPLLSKEGLEYLNELTDELLRTTAKVIIAVGGAALFALCGKKGILKWRGSILKSPKIPNRIIIPVIHTATVIPPKSQY